jgi:hypothetical protein
MRYSGLTGGPQFEHDIAASLPNKWFSSGGVGLEFAANMGDYDMVDLNVNAYGNFFNSSGLVNAFRNKGTSYDIEGGYSHALLNQSLDLRLKLAGYQYNAGALFTDGEAART